MNATPGSWPAPADDVPDAGQSGEAATRIADLGGLNPAFRERGAAGARPSAPAAATAGPVVSVLAERLAAALVHHEPGWRLPRHSALARRYNVSTAEIDTAVEELVGRHLVRRLADGQLYRASPAEYVLGLEGVPGLLSQVDAMGAEFSCRSRQVTWRLPPEDISWALGLTAHQQVCMVRSLWTAGGEPAALCTTYVSGELAAPAGGGAVAELPVALNLMQMTGIGDGSSAGIGADGQPVIGSPAALHIEMQAPPPAVARNLRLTAGQPAMMVTVRFDQQETGRPVALAIAVLRPDMFRVVVQSPGPLLPDGTAGNLSDSWALTGQDWES